MLMLQTFQLIRLRILSKSFAQQCTQSMFHQLSKKANKKGVKNKMIDMEMGDLFEGQGANTAAKAQGVKKGAAESVAQNPTGLNVGATQGNVLGAWLLVAGVLVALTLVLQRFSPEQTFSHVKLGFYNMVVIGFYSVLFITIGKVVFTKYRVAGLTPLFLSA